MPLVECPAEGCSEAVPVDVDPGNLRKVGLQSNVGGLDSVAVTCDDGHEFYVHH